MDCPQYDADMGLHLYFGGKDGALLSPGSYDFRVYIGKQVIRGFLPADDILAVVEQERAAASN